MNSPTKKVKQTSLSDFYRKVDHHSEINPDYSEINPKTQSPSNIELTPTKIKPSQNTLSNLSSNLVPSYVAEQYNNLNIDSNVKPKWDNDQRLQINDNLNPPNYIQYNANDNDSNRNLFAKLPYPQAYQPQSYFPHLYQPQSNLNSNTQQNHQFSQISQRHNNEYSEIDYNLSVQPEEIKIPADKRFQHQVKQFNYDDQKLDSNFLITPESSLIKSPEKLIDQSQNHFTPQIPKNQEKIPPTSQVIERLRFNSQHEETTQKKQQKSPHKIRIKDNPKTMPQPFNIKKNESSSPQSLSKRKSNIPSPNVKKIPKRTESIEQSSQNLKVSPKRQQILSSDEDQDSSELLTKIRQLQSQVSQLKTHKYEFAIKKYRQETKYELQKQLQMSLRQINSKYDQQQLGLKRQTEVEVNLFNKSIEDIAKYKKTYAIILNQLKENRGKIQEEYRDKLQGVRKFKERVIQEWKRNSNEEIKKIINNTHTKHHVHLSASKEKHAGKSKEKITPFYKEKLSPLTSSK